MKVPDVIMRILGSSKAVLALLGMAAYIAARYGFEFEPEEAWIWISPLIAAIIGQGVADIGKPAAQVTAAAAERLATGTATPNAEPSAKVGP